MHSGTTFKKKPSGEAGFSLIEMLIVMTIMIIILGVLGSVVSGVETIYAQQRPRTEAINNANAAMDMMTRLIRLSGNNLSGTGITPGSTGADGLYHTIRIQADWNSVRGGLTGTYEDSTFSLSNNSLQIVDGANSQTSFIDNIGSVTFTYYDNTNTLISDPVGNNDDISLVKIDLTTTGVSPMTFTTMAHVRKN
jgi:type II secretory pathway pseudopilin PulG